MLDFIFAKLLFTLQLNADYPDPYALYGIREDFMKTLRAASCSQDGICETCGAKTRCAFHNTFSQDLSDDPAAVKHHQKPPPPFAMEFPCLSANFSSGEVVEIGLTLAGSAVNHVAEYITSARALFADDNPAAKLGGRIIKVESLTCSGSRHLVMGDPGTVSLDCVATISSRDLMEMNTLDREQIKLSILSPMRIFKDGKPLRNFSFSPFFRALMRRISSLAYHYYRSGFGIDYKGLASSSMEVETVASDFYWVDLQERPGSERVCGLMGNGVFKGRMEDFHLFLLLGEYLNAGKGATFGLGQFKVER